MVGNHVKSGLCRAIVPPVTPQKLNRHIVSPVSLKAHLKAPGTPDLSVEKFFHGLTFQNFLSVIVLLMLLQIKTYFYSSGTKSS